TSEKTNRRVVLTRFIDCLSFW
ncbi:ComEC family competence protein, partial [Haemophilus influenzae]